MLLYYYDDVSIVQEVVKTLKLILRFSPAFFRFLR